MVETASVNQSVTMDELFWHDVRNVNVSPSTNSESSSDETTSYNDQQSPSFSASSTDVSSSSLENVTTVLPPLSWFHQDPRNTRTVSELNHKLASVKTEVNEFPFTRNAIVGLSNSGKSINISIFPGRIFGIYLFFN